MNFVIVQGRSMVGVTGLGGLGIFRCGQACGQIRYHKEGVCGEGQGQSWGQGWCVVWYLGQGLGWFIGCLVIQAWGIFGPVVKGLKCLCTY